MADEPKNPDENTEVPAEDVVEFPEHGSILEGADGKEKIVHDFDEDGNPTGWHKEVVEEDK